MTMQVCGPAWLWALIVSAVAAGHIAHAYGQGRLSAPRGRDKG